MCSRAGTAHNAPVSQWSSYCTSDNWSGNASVTYSSGTTWQFRGKRVIEAVVETLYSSFGMKTASEVRALGLSISAR